VKSQGKKAPVGTGQDSKKKKTDELFEASKARQEMKPVLIFFAKSRDILSFGKKVKDREVDATQHYEKEIFGRYAITQLAKEFICIKVDTRKADKRLLAKTYRARRAPVVVIVDLYGRTLYRLSNPKMSYRQLAKVMSSAIKRVEKEVGRLAKSSEESPLIDRAKTRWAEIEMRGLCDKAADYTFKRNWALAEKKYKEVLGHKEDNQYKKVAKIGLREVQAGKLFTEGEAFYKHKRYRQAKEVLDKVIKIRESKIYKQMATDLLKKVNKKIKK
jgi:predicted negative regulator of RcsB-dependent stress response